MVRTLTTSAMVAVSFASMAFAGPGCPGTAQEVAETKPASDCATQCPMTGAAVQTVADTGAKSGEGKSCSSPCDETKKAACDKPCDEKDSAVSLVSHMPAMGYKVGDKESCCPKMAGEMAEEAGSSVHFVVNGHEYGDRVEAMRAHEKQLREYLVELTRVQYAVDGECVPCPESAKKMASSCDSKKMQYKVGPAVFDSAEEAVRASVMAWNAAQKSHTEYAVGEQTMTCSTSAGKMAEKAGCGVEYVVDGERTKCDKQAGYMDTMARVESALKAIEAVKGQA